MVVVHVHGFYRGKILSIEGRILFYWVVVHTL